MKAILTRDFKCAPEGHTVILAGLEGDTVEGRIAEIAVEAGAAEEIKPKKRRTRKPKETKPAFPEE